MLSKESPSLGYKTIIYPISGQPLVIHDSLYDGQIASDAQLSELSEFWKIDEQDFDALNTADLHNLDLGFPSRKVNPCTGLPMLDDAIDVAGNIYGMHYIESDPL
ncbi:hypothetical protein [Stutzerimonas kunmingensis]|uniref:hypothetical protein n=1 Tax=Stutzerimonas kunmingensis TaxID=1211807 RepID=UPI001F1ABD9D|nr:hypothetical protein [Stutzerimonas kunmingensis]UIP31120.1 hypothetical protein LW136_13260 [Stutzerimonas kunmingensis]